MRCGDQSCAIEDLEFGPPSGKIQPAWSLAMSDLSGTVAFAVNNTQPGQHSAQYDYQSAWWASGPMSPVDLDTVFLQTSPLGILATQATSIAPDPHNSNVAYLGLSGFTADTHGRAHLQDHQLRRHLDPGRRQQLSNGVIVQSPTGLPDVPVLKVLVDSTDNSGSCGGNPAATASMPVPISASFTAPTEAKPGKPSITACQACRSTIWSKTLPGRFSPEPTDAAFTVSACRLPPRLRLLLRALHPLQRRLLLPPPPRLAPRPRPQLRPGPLLRLGLRPRPRHQLGQLHRPGPRPRLQP